MKTKILRSVLFLGLLLNLAANNSFAQEASPAKFGKIDEAEIKMTTYQKDPNASAVVLFDYGNVIFYYSENDGFKREFEVHIKIKILKKDAYDLANIKIGYNSGNKDKIIDIKGFTYNLENGQVQKIKLEKDAIFDEKVADGYSYKKFALPSVKEGSVIEYTYKSISDSYFTLPTWRFQSFHPVVWSEYKIEIPEYFNYVTNSQAYQAFSISEQSQKNESINFAERTRSEGTVTSSSVEYTKVDYTVNINRWVMKDVPAFKDEKFITSYKDCINLIEMQLASTQYPNSPIRPVLNSWEKLTEQLLKHESYGGFLEKRSPLKDLVAKLIAGQTTPKDKMNVIYNHLKNNFKYNDDDGILTDKKMKEVIEKQEGSSAEINLLLVAMLREAGLEAFPILLSTRGNGKINVTYPILSKFNYNIAYVTFGEEEHLLDATDPMRPVDMLPEYALSEQGLLIMKEGQFSWANLLNRYKSSKTIFAKLDIGAEGMIKGEMNIGLNGYEAVDARRLLEKKESKKDEEAEGEAKKDESEYEKLKVSFENLKEYEQPLKGKSNYESAEFAEVGSNRIYLNPMLSFKMKENPFKAVDRKFPVDFSYPFEETYYLNFTIPEGYTAEEIPQSVRMVFEDKSIKFDYLVSSQIANVVQVMCKLIVSRALFQPEEYANLKDLFAKIVAKQNEQIVLKKK